MEAYLVKVCIFICLGDLLTHFLPSEKFAKLYRSITGMMMLLLILEPLGKNVADSVIDNAMEEKLWERISGQENLWNADLGTEWIKEETNRMMEAYLGEFTEEEMAEELNDYGYTVTVDESEEIDEKKAGNRQEGEADVK